MDYYNIYWLYIVIYILFTPKLNFPDISILSEVGGGKHWTSDFNSMDEESVPLALALE